MKTKTLLAAVAALAIGAAHAGSFDAQTPPVSISLKEAQMRAAVEEGVPFTVCAIKPQPAGGNSFAGGGRSAEPWYILPATPANLEHFVTGLDAYNVAEVKREMSRPGAPKPRFDDETKRAQLTALETVRQRVQEAGKPCFEVVRAAGAVELVAADKKLRIVQFFAPGQPTYLVTDADKPAPRVKEVTGLLFVSESKVLNASGKAALFN